MPRNLTFANLTTMRYYSTQKAASACTKGTNAPCQITSGLRALGFGRIGVKKGSTAADAMSTLCKVGKITKGSSYSHCQSAGARAEVFDSAGKYLAHLRANSKAKSDGRADRKTGRNKKNENGNQGH